MVYKALVKAKPILNDYNKEEVVFYLNHTAKLGKVMYGHTNCQPTKDEINYMEILKKKPKFL